MPDNLPKVVHGPTMKVVRTMLLHMGLPLPAGLDEWTVHDIFHGTSGLKQMGAVLGWNIKVRSKDDFIAEVKDKVLETLEREMKNRKK
eukprot:1012720-Rhodomonas_salina.3